ncbi:biliverdin-producing heme oxygenase [Moraxella bovoculi]|nr:biliverdin-producing heme oxygenase [Moraxella bovoculi]
MKYEPTYPNRSPTHDAVDYLLMSMNPFASHDNYRKFLQAQYEFHSTVNPIYQDAQLAGQFDGLTDLARLDRVKSDMKDLEVEPYGKDVETSVITGSEAIGWLYCVEGSNVGAAILYKESGKIDLKRRLWCISSGVTRRWSYAALARHQSQDR